MSLGNVIVVGKNLMNNPIEAEPDDEIINVTMPRGDYNIMRAMIKDRKSTSFVMNKIKTFSLTLSGVLAAWYFLGEKLLLTLKGLVK